MPYTVDQLDVIFAEDDMVFQEITLPAIVKAGVSPSRIFQAEHGGLALAHLQSLQTGNPHEPIVMLLDVRMPVMDGIQCCQKVLQLQAQGLLRRRPYLVCVSSSIVEVSFGGEAGFHITMPKPFSHRQLEMVVTMSQEWWEGGGAIGVVGEPAVTSVGGSGDHIQNGVATAADAAIDGDRVTAADALAGSRADAAPAAAPWDLCKLDMIVGHREPICRMALVTSLALLGADEAHIVEASDKEEFATALREAQGTSGPLLIFLGSTKWISAITPLEGFPRKPYMVSTSVDSQFHAAFDLILPPQYNREDLRRALEQYQLSYGS